MKSTIIRTVSAVVVCAVMLAVMSGYARDTWTYQLTQTVATQTEKVTLKPLSHEPWNKLKEKYPDTVGYLKVPGTDINEVVVQSKKDNDYYLRRGPDQKYRYSGSYFMDYRNVADLSQNITIYGHNLNDPSRYFGQLLRYKELDFYKKNPIIYFDTENTVGRWKIVAMFLTNINTRDGVRYDWYRKTNFASQEEFLYQFIERSRRRSYIDCPVDVVENDRILTLYVCDYALNRSGDKKSQARFIVIARQLREGEDETVDVSKATVNKDVLMPEGYYDLYGGTRPTFPDEPLLSDPTTVATTTKKK